MGGPAVTGPAAEAGEPGAFAPYVVTVSGEVELPANDGESVSSPGHVDASALARAPVAPYPPSLISDGIAFTGDIAMGLPITISGADVGDRWNWKYYEPGGALVATSCDTQIVAPGAPWNPSTTDPALVSFCGVPVPFVYGVFVGGCPCSTGGFLFGDYLQVAGTQWEDATGTWTVAVDFATVPAR